ncbi:helix-turn-helix domain-containing protein [Streptomyces mirabilis]
MIAKDLRVSVRSLQRWRQAWEEGGPSALRSQGPASLPRLSDKQFAQLEAGLSKGPAAHGWGDQRWTLGRVKTVIGRRFHLAYTIQGDHHDNTFNLVGPTSGMGRHAWPSRTNRH